MSTLYNFRLVFLIFTINFSLFACSTVSPQRNYLLDTLKTSVAQPTSNKNATGKVLQVSIPQAASGFDTNAFIYIRTPNVLEHYSQSQWVDTPARMLLPLIVHRLETTGHFAAVLSSSMTSTVAGELRLDTEILRLQQEFLTYPSQIRLVLRAQLLDMAAGTVLATQVFTSVVKASSENVEGGVIAAERAVKEVLEELATFVVARSQ